MRAADLFAGWGGFSLGLSQAGIDVVWAADHWPLAVDAHRLNHPQAIHVTQDLNQTNFYDVPDIDLLCAGPSCPGFSSAAQPMRKKSPDVRGAHDKLRANAWAVVSCVEAKRPTAILVENVVQFRKWPLYGCWVRALETLGYTLEEHVLIASHFGVPQRRERPFVVGVRAKRPLGLVMGRQAEPGIGPCLELDAGSWSALRDATPQVRARVARARARGLGVNFLTQHVTGHPGVSFNEPIRTITTKDQWAIVKGELYRPLSVRETARAMGFPDDYGWPKSTRKDQIRGLGNAVCPPVACALGERILATV